MRLYEAMRFLRMGLESSGCGEAVAQSRQLLFGILRLDGMKLPKLTMLRVNPRKKPARSYGDMIDYVDEKPPVTFEDLDDAEKDLCILLADLICCALCAFLSLLFG